MTKKYGVGIVGAGWVAGEYVKAFRDHPLTYVVGMYSKTPGKATNLTKTHGVDGKEFTSFEEMLDDKRIQIVAHCAHADTRADMISRAALSGRHVVIEKPAGTTPEGTAKIRQAVTKSGVKSIARAQTRGLRVNALPDWHSCPHHWAGSSGGWPNSRRARGSDLIAEGKVYAVEGR